MTVTLIPAFPMKHKGMSLKRSLSFDRANFTGTDFCDDEAHHRVLLLSQEVQKRNHVDLGVVETMSDHRLKLLVILLMKRLIMF